MAMRDPTEFLGRKKPARRFRAISKFDPRLKSHNRPVVPREEVLPEDTPNSDTISNRR